MLLGILEKPISPADTSFLFFPSKIGGRPSWLSLKNIPDRKLAVCKICGGYTVLLLQIYAPKTGDHCYHRTIYVFCCRNPQCYKSNNPGPFVVLRCNLARNNLFYGKDLLDPDFEDAKVFEMERALREKFTVKLCSQCGMSARAGCCGKNKKKVIKFFPEYLLIFDQFDEPLPIPDEERVKNQLKIIDELNKSLPRMSSANEERDLDALVKLAYKEQSEMCDKEFTSFCNKTAFPQQQVVRYSNGETPLYISSKNQPLEADIPVCEHCGGKLNFEFQILPQLIHKLDTIGNNLVHLDWGTLLVYTCPKVCSPLGEGVYYREFLWKQDI